MPSVTQKQGEQTARKPLHAHNADSEWKFKTKSPRNSISISWHVDSLSHSSKTSATCPQNTTFLSTSAVPAKELCTGTSQELSHSPSEMTKCHWKLSQCTPGSPSHWGGRSQVPSHTAEQRLDAQTPSQGWHQGRHQAQGSRALCLQLHPRGGGNV